MELRIDESKYGGRVVVAERCDFALFRRYRNSKNGGYDNNKTAVQQRLCFFRRELKKANPQGRAFGVELQSDPSYLRHIRNQRAKSLAHGAEKTRRRLEGRAASRGFRIWHSVTREDLEVVDARYEAAATVPVCEVKPKVRRSARLAG